MKTKIAFTVFSLFFNLQLFSQTAPAIEWQKSLGGTNDENAYSIQQTADGGYIAAGYSKSSNGDVTGNHGFYDYWVVKLDGAGNIQWQKCLGGTSYDQAFSIQQTADGGYVVAGWSYSNDGDVTGNHGGDDYWVVKLDTAGIIQWQKSLGGTNDDYAQSIQQTADWGYVIAGGSGSNDGDVTGNHGGADYWIVKLAPDTVTGISPTPSLPGGEGVAIAPNPFTSSLTLKGTSKKGELILFDITGKEILRIKTFDTETKINTAQLTPGLYFINYKEENKSVNLKAVKF